MDDGPPATSILPLLLGAAAVCILLSMFFSACESAFLSINKLRVRLLRKQNNKRAVLTGKLLDKKTILLNTVLVGNNIVNIALSALLTIIAYRIWGSAGAGIAAGISTILLLIFGEIIPKTLGMAFSERIAFALTPVLRFFIFLLAPVVRVFTWIAESLTALLGLKQNERQVSYTEEEIKTFIDVGEEEGVLNSGETHMLQSVFKFTDLDAKEIMVPRTKIAAVHINTPFYDILTLSRESHFSRFPVYDRDIDDIKGILYIKDTLFYDESKPFSIKEIMRPPLFILENKKMSSIQQTLLENNQNMAIVLDEYSGTLGLLTMEDLAEEIFGSISDEHDAPEKPLLFHKNDSEVILDGTARLSDIAEKMHIPLESEFYDTIGGFITEKIGEIPSVGTRIEFAGYVFTVLEIQEHHATKVRISRKADRE